jgi:hypothetical protein
VSKKLPGIRLVSIELEINREATAECAKTLQQVRPSGLTRDTKLPGIGDMDFDLIAFLQLKRLNYGRRKTHGKAIAPFCDLHI